MLFMSGLFRREMYTVKQLDGAVLWVYSRQHRLGRAPL